MSSRKYPRLQSLKEINNVMARYYVQRKAMARLKPLAYVTSGAPIEIMEAMGILTLYPENYGAICGARGASVRLCQVAEASGYPADLCSYARGHIGAVIQPKDAPLKGMPRPDLLVCCNNIFIRRPYTKISETIKRSNRFTHFSLSGVFPISY